MKVTLINQGSSKLIHTELEVLPRQNDFIWFDENCFQVDKVVHSYNGCASGTNYFSDKKPNYTGTTIFIMPLPRWEAISSNPKVNNWYETKEMKDFVY